jgi:biopolymer transport protein ExbD
MPKLKMPRSSPSLDMTPMVDLAFLLVTFFMLTTQFRADEPVIVDMPSSIAEIKIPEIDVMTITVDDKGQVFFNIDGKETRAKVIAKMGEKYKVNFTPDEIKRFSIITSFGMPVNELKNYLPKKEMERKELYVAMEKAGRKGIPYDSLNNQLSDWILQSRYANPKFRIAIKGDGDSPYPTVKKVIEILQKNKVNKFNLITSMETGAAPEAK